MGNLLYSFKTEGLLPKTVNRWSLILPSDSTWLYEWYIALVNMINLQFFTGKETWSTSFSSSKWL